MPNHRRGFGLTDHDEIDSQLREVKGPKTRGVKGNRQAKNPVNPRPPILPSQSKALFEMPKPFGVSARARPAITFGFNSAHVPSGIESHPFIYCRPEQNGRQLDSNSDDLVRLPFAPQADFELGEPENEEEACLDTCLAKRKRN